MNAKRSEIGSAGVALKRLVENFEVLVEAEGGTEGLRGMVLDLALHARLVDRRGPDLAREELSRLGSVSTIDAEEVPYHLPLHWSWTHLGDLVASVTDGDHQPPPKVQAGVPFLTIGNVSSGKLTFEGTRFVSREYFGSLDPRRVPRHGDVIYTVVGSFGIPVHVDVTRDFCVQRHIAIIRPGAACDRDFLYLFLRSPLAYRQAVQCATGIAQPTVGLKPLRRFMVPTPPRAEQRRIVEKANALMRRLDDLDTKLASKRESKSRLRAASLDALTSAQGIVEWGPAWGRLSNNFDALFDRRATVSELRAAILDLAVSGRFHTTPPVDCSLSTGGPFAIPSAWRWAPLGELVLRTDYGTSRKAHTEPSGVPVLRMNNIQNGALDVRNLKYVPLDTENLDVLTLAEGDLLFNRTNSFELVGKMAVFRQTGRFTFASYLIRVRLDERLAIPEYVNIYFSSRRCRATQIEPHITRQTNQANFNGSKLKEVLIPLPSIEVQRAIVQRVAAFMTQCEKFEAQLLLVEETAAKLVDAVAAEMLA